MGMVLSLLWVHVPLLIDQLMKLLNYTCYQLPFGLHTPIYDCLANTASQASHRLPDFECTYKPSSESSPAVYPSPPPANGFCWHLSSQMPVEIVVYKAIVFILTPPVCVKTQDTRNQEALACCTIKVSPKPGFLPLSLTVSPSAARVTPGYLSALLSSLPALC